jgi:hypothetical protein
MLRAKRYTGRLRPSFLSLKRRVLGSIHDTCKKKEKPQKSFIIQLSKKKTKGGFAVTKCNTIPIPFTTCKRRLVQASFSGGDITSDGGSVLLREMDRRLKLTSSLAQMLEDGRDKKKVQHDYLSLLRQRVCSTLPSS